MPKRLCCIFNYAPHYRFAIYQKMGEELDAHFYFGDGLRSEYVNKFDTRQLTGFQQELHVKFYTFPFNWEWYRGLITLAFDKRYNRYLITPDIMAPGQWFLLILCKLMGKKVYSWRHGARSKNISRRILWMDKLFHSFLSGSFIYGHKARNNMIHLGYRADKLHVIYNSLDYDAMLGYRKKLSDQPIYADHFKNHYPVLLFIGRLTVVKKLTMIVEAHQVLAQKGVKTNVVFIGDGTITDELKQLVKANGYSNQFWFRGAMYDEGEIAEMMYNATMCISPGNVGLTAMHALSYGLPIITNDNFDTQMPEHEAIKDGINGAFFKEDNIDSLVEKIEQLLADKTNRQFVRQQCYQPIDEFYNPYTQVAIFKKVFADQ